MIISAILVVALLICAAYGLMHGSRSLLVRVPIVLFSLLGVYFVLVPETTSRIAHALGVGRGADLILYCWVVTSLAMFIQLQFATLKTNETITRLARRLAIETAASNSKASSGGRETAKIDD